MRQGSFLGLFSFDNQLVMPLAAYKKYFGVHRAQTELRVKVTDKDRIEEAREELTGAMRRVRGLLPGQRDNFSINEQQAFKQQLDPVKQGIALAGLFVTGLALFVGRHRDHEHHIRQRPRAHAGDRHAQGPRRAAPDDPPAVPVESVSISLIGGLAGLALTFSLCLAVELRAARPCPSSSRRASS